MSATGGLVSSPPALDRAVLAALAEPNRFAIVELLRDGPMTVGAIAECLGLRQPQASKHLKVLRQDSILEVRAEANRRIYALRAEPFHALNQWAESFRDVMEQRFDKLDDYLRSVQKKDNSTPRSRRRKGR